MKFLIIIVVIIPALVTAKKCTNPTGGTTAGATNGPTPGTTDGATDYQRETTTPLPPLTTTEDFETTTPYYPPPEYWPRGKWALVKAGNQCPGFFKFKGGGWYMDTEDNFNGNQWTLDGGWPGKMKKDGFELFFCTKTKKNDGKGVWPAGDYCIHRVGKKCPSKEFKTGSIKWDNENDFNSNMKIGKTLPDGIYGVDTTQYFCCRNDSSANSAIDLPVTKPFYLYRHTSGRCQKVRGMTVTEEFIQFDDEDDESNGNNKKGAHPYDSGNNTNHRLHYCHYRPKGQSDQ